jgi:hypothetical protein
MSDYSAQYKSFFLNSFSSIIELETVQLSHVNFSRSYFFVRNATGGITARLENGVMQAFQYYPAKITRQGSDTTLDQQLQIDLGDLGSVLPMELDRIAAASNFVLKPMVIFRSYRSDNLNAPMYGPVTFLADNISFTKAGSTIAANAPQLNTAETGETYTLDRFPMLNGLL